ncbi:iron ABC transporter permease [Desulfopila sp. IMCC35008]|uniref:ABC transporter permease n=1 Tax=Desulfopila sp. IMCC35008 TaxID=2653858 RepID=UPI00197AC0DF|nr:iron ABC transporter permease [Desulfopila sp. IMCC35008]
MTQSQKGYRWLLFSLPLLFLGVFYFYPLGKIILFSFFPDSGSSFPGAGRLFATADYLRVIWFTTWQAALSTILTIALALPGSYVFARYRFPAKGLLQAMLTVPFVLPTVVVAAAFRALLGSNGLINGWLTAIFGLSDPPISLEQSVWFFLLAHVFYNYSLVLRIVGSFWAGINPGIRSAAVMLGASPFTVFIKITLPLLLPAIGSAALLVFIFCFTSFGVILILGGPGYATIEVEIYRQAVQLFNLPMAAALSLIQIVINFLLMLVHARLSRRTGVAFFGESSGTDEVAINSPVRGFFVGGNLLFMVCLLVSPLFALIVRSFTGRDGLTLAYYTALFNQDRRSVFFVEPIQAVMNSVGFGLVAMMLAVVLGMSASIFLASGKKQSFWDAVVMLPLATSAVTLGFGYIITLNKPPLNLRDSLALVPLAHALVAFPFVVRCILPALRQVPQSLRDAAAMLGASPARVWWQVDLALVRKSLLVGAIFGFVISMGEFGASAFLVRPHTPTMPVAIFRFLGQPGELNYGQAMAMSSLLMLVSCLGFWLLSRFDRPAGGRNET